MDAANAAIRKARRDQPIVQRRIVLERAPSQCLDVSGHALELRPDGLQPGLVLRELRVPDTSPQHDPVFLGEVLHDFDAAIRLLKSQFVGHAIARLPARAHHRRRLQQKRAIHDPQPAVARRADLERRQTFLDLARLPDVADG